MQRKLANVLNHGATAFVVLALGIALSAAAALLTARKVERDAATQFERAVDYGHGAIDARIRTYSDMLLGVRGLFIASDAVTREEFRSYVASLELNRRYPGIQIIHYAQRVSHDQRQAFERAVRNDRSIDPGGYPDYAIKAPAQRAEYFAVQYAEPMVGNERALGLELGGDKVRLAALERTRDSGRITASGTIALADDPRRHPGFAMRLPVYRKNMPVATVEQRRQAFAGIVSASFIVIDLMRGVLNEDYLRTMHVRIHDAGYIAANEPKPPSADNMMFDSDRLRSGTRQDTERSDIATLAKVVALEVGGRTWNMHFTAREGFIPRSERLLPWLAMLAGCVISALLFGLIRSLATSGRRAIRLAARITQDLRASEARLADSQRMTEQLLEALPNPIFFKGTDGRYLGVNRAWENLFGVPRTQIVGKTLHELHAARPELAAGRQASDEALWDSPGTQCFETTIRTADARSRAAIYYKATVTRADGTVAGLIGTIVDITERKKLEQQFEATFDQAAVGIAHFDLEHRNIRVNRRYSEIVGYRPDELIGKQPGFLNHPDDHALSTGQREQLLTGEIDHYSQEKRYIRKDGRVVWVTRTESLARDANGAPSYFIRVIEDITDRKQAAERYRATFENAPVGIMHTAVDNDRILHANDKLCEMLGYSHDELSRMMTDDFIHPDYVNSDQPVYRDKMLRGEIDSFSSERLYRRKDGSDLWVNRTVSLVKDAAGEPLYFIRIIEDISDRKQAENRLAMEHAVARVLAGTESLAEAIPVIIRTICETLKWHCGARWAHDEDARVMRCVENWGVNSPEIREFMAVNSKRTVATDEDGQGLVRQAVRTGKPVWVADLSHAAGFKRAALVAKARLHGAFCFPLLVDNQVLGVMEFFHRDVREPDEMLIHATQSIGSQIGQYMVRKQVEERVRRLAHYDELTGLANRTMFTERLQHAINRARRADRSAVVLFIDLDRFKNINDTLGHDAGDYVLKEVAHRLQSNLRESDTVGRLGGDEFIVLLEEPPRPLNAAVVAQKILTALCRPYSVKGQEFDITASIGISTYPNDGADIQTLMKNADIAMYRAKEQGKNNFQFYSAQFNVHSIERLTLESSLRRALERDEFVLHYQPKLDVVSGRITGVEALLRWEQPSQGLIPPAQFIELAEETGLIVPIGEWVLRTACQQSVDWQSQGCPPVRVAVNLSPRQFASEKLLDDVTRALARTGMNPALLELEITESVVTHHPEQTVVLLQQLKALGIHLSIDDFGTGYSSLSHLKRFPLDTLKIDRTFIRDLPGDADDAAITQAIIAMAHSLRLSVVAEGVETAEQMSFLRALDCEEIQGYYFSKPQPAEAIATLIRQHAATITLSKPELSAASNDAQVRPLKRARQRNRT